eukprot:TRINITY_DN302_c0_g3_i1.p2 TRINITY_DN302_c0_g3~~TRINITY_DN302_c0_g3_i1.p2  ORF type:complete len:218 (-),score=53.31 TRINITY_DN302_c0_g3_i1:91-744(-)
MGNNDSKSLQATNFTELKVHIAEANKLGEEYTDRNGNHLKFDLYPKYEADIPIIPLFKLFVKILVTKNPPEGSPPIKRQTKVLNFKLFYKLFFFMRTNLQLVKKANEEANENVDNNENNNNNINEIEETLGYLDDFDENECPICFENEIDTLLNCHHGFCAQCIDNWKAKSGECPLCRSIDPPDDVWTIIKTDQNEGKELKRFFEDYIETILAESEQ